MYALLAAKSRGLETDTLEFAQELIRTPSPSLEESDVARLVEDRMRALGYEKVFADEYGNVIGVLWGRQGQPTVLLSSHMDTAEVGEPADWRDSPYSGEIRDGVLCGLGASDCKAGLAAQIYAGVLLKRALLPLQGNVVVAATVSEEQGGSLGLGHLVQGTLPSLDLRPDFAILGEPTSLSIYYGHDGSAVYEVLVEGPDTFQVNDATQAVFENLRGNYRATRAAGEPEHQSLCVPRFQRSPGSVCGVINVCRRLPDTETVGGMLEQIKQEAHPRLLPWPVSPWTSWCGARTPAVHQAHHHPGTTRGCLVARSVSPVDHPVAAGIVGRRPPRVVRQIPTSSAGYGHCRRCAVESVWRARHRIRSRLGGHLSRAKRVGVGGSRGPVPLWHGCHHAQPRGSSRLWLDRGRDMNISSPTPSAKPCRKSGRPCARACKCSASRWIRSATRAPNSCRWRWPLREALSRFGWSPPTKKSPLRAWLNRRLGKCVHGDIPHLIHARSLSQHLRDIARVMAREAFFGGGRRLAHSESIVVHRKTLAPGT